MKGRERPARGEKDRQKKDLECKLCNLLYYYSNLTLRITPLYVHDAKPRCTALTPTKQMYSSQNTWMYPIVFIQAKIQFRPPFFVWQRGGQIQSNTCQSCQNIGKTAQWKLKFQYQPILTFSKYFIDRLALLHTEKCIEIEREKKLWSQVDHFPLFL